MVKIIISAKTHKECVLYNSTDIENDEKIYDEYVDQYFEWLADQLSPDFELEIDDYRQTSNSYTVENDEKLGHEYMMNLSDFWTWYN